MILSTYLTTRTKFAKFLAIIIFILLPFGGFFFGMAYQQKVDEVPQVSNPVDYSNPSPTPMLTITTTKTPSCDKSLADPSKRWVICAPKDLAEVRVRNQNMVELLFTWSGESGLSIITWSSSATSQNGDLRKFAIVSNPNLDNENVVYESIDSTCSKAVRFHSSLGDLGSSETWVKYNNFVIQIESSPDPYPKYAPANLPELRSANDELTSAFCQSKS